MGFANDLPMIQINENGPVGAGWSHISDKYVDYIRLHTSIAINIVHSPHCAIHCFVHCVLGMVLGMVFGHCVGHWVMQWGRGTRLIAIEVCNCAKSY